MRSLAILLTLVPVGTICAQSMSQLSAPTLSYLFDSESRSLRVVGGVPGSASVDGVLPLGDKVEAAYFDPARRFALVRFHEGKSAVVQLRNLQTIALEGAVLATKVVLSPSGAVALLVNSDSGEAQVWSGLTSQPALARTLSLRPFEAAAITDDGNRIALGSAEGLRLMEGSVETALSVADGITALTFSRAGDELIAANGKSDTLSSWRNEGGEWKAQQIASVQDGVDGPVAVAYTSSGKLLVANKRGRSILQIDTSGSINRLECDCEPSLLTQAQGDAVFQISAAQDQQIYFFDGDAASPRLFSIFAGGAR